MFKDFLLNDLKSVNISQPASIIDPKFTFLDKFLEKRLQRKIIKVDQSKVNSARHCKNSEAIHNELYKSGVSQKHLIFVNIYTLLIFEICSVCFIINFKFILNCFLCNLWLDNYTEIYQYFFLIIKY